MILCDKICIVVLLVIFQDLAYDTCVDSLVKACFEGYNATVFAYGQTVSQFYALVLDLEWCLMISENFADSSSHNNYKKILN